MNFDSVSRATQGLVDYLRTLVCPRKAAAEGRSWSSRTTRASFSTDFTTLAAEIAAKTAATPVIFDGPRSTPELSFAVPLFARERRRGDYGKPQSAARQRLQSLLQRRRAGDRAARQWDHRPRSTPPVAPPPDEVRGEIITLGREVDEAYMARLGNTRPRPGAGAVANAICGLSTP